jgi:hypothetical protein
VSGYPYAYLYRPLVERSLLNYQVQHLASHYDFGKQSRVAALIATRVNESMQEAENSLGIQRVPPFHLYLKWRGAKLILPLFAPEYLKPIVERRGGFRMARELVRAGCFQVARKAGIRMAPAELLGVVDPEAFVRQERRDRRALSSTDELIDPKREREQIEELKPLSPLERVDELDGSAPRSVLNALREFVHREAGRGPAVAEHLVEELISLRSICSPRLHQLSSGEMPFLATSVTARPAEETRSRYRRLQPVILTLWSSEELEGRAWEEPPGERELARRIVRVCFEAYRQGGLLSLMDLQWIFQCSATRVSKLMRSMQKRLGIVVPIPGTILDAGRSMTHKDIVIDLHLRGYSVREIARMTYHSPRAVDSYIGTFEAVLILQLYHVPPPLMARVLGKGISLVQEHLEIARAHFPDQEQMKRLLVWKEVRV